MPKFRDDLPDADTFFARLDKFHLACPSCDEMILVVDRPPKKHAGSVTGVDPQFNPLTHTLKCPRCERVFGVGLLLWSLNSSRRVIASDQKPNRRQLLQIRNKAAGYWPKTTLRPGQPRNLAIAPRECTCPPDGGWAPHCPIHKWDWEKNQPADLNDRED